MSCCEPSVSPLSSGSIGPVLSEMLSVANIAALAPLTYGDGTGIYVRSVRDYFVYRADSTATVDSITVVAHASATGRWERLNIPHPSWAAQTVWEINSGNNPELDGLTALTAIPYHEFLRRRCASDATFAVASGMLDININADMPVSDPLILSPDLAPGVTLRVNGVPTIAFAGTVSAKTDLSTAGTGTPAAITCVGWTVASLLNKPVKDVTNNRWSVIAKDNGAGSARVANWMAINESAGSISTTASTPATTLGASVEVYTLPVVALVRYTGTGVVVFNKLEFSATTTGFFVSRGQPRYQNCNFSGEQRFACGLHSFNNCRVHVGSPDSTDPVILQIIGGVVTQGFSNVGKPAANTVDLANHVLFQGASVMSVRHGLLRIRNAFFEDCANPVGFNALITLQSSAQILATSASTVRGNGNTCNVLRMDSGTRCSLGLGANWTTVFSVATSAHNGICINGTAAGAPAGAKTTVRPTDPATDLPFATPLSTTFANLQAAYSGGTGFGGFMKDAATDVWAGA